MKRHLKRIAVPKTWPILKRIGVYTTRPRPGGHPFDMAMPLSLFLKEVVDVGVNTRNEAKKVIDAKQVQIDGKTTDNYRRPVGFMDVVSIPSLKKHFRLVLNGTGKLVPIEVDEKEAKQKAVQVKRKTVIKKGVIQVTTSDGRNIKLAKNDYKVGDTLVLELPSQKVLKHIPLKEGAHIYLIGGKHIGHEGKLKSIDGKHVHYEDENKNETLTLKAYAMPLGTGKSEVKIHE